MITGPRPAKTPLSSRWSLALAERSFDHVAAVLFLFFLEIKLGLQMLDALSALYDSSIFNGSTLGH